MRHTDTYQPAREKRRNSQTGVSRLKEKLGGNHRKRWALCCKGKYSVITTPGNEKKERAKDMKRKVERGKRRKGSVSAHQCADTLLKTPTDSHP